MKVLQHVKAPAKQLKPQIIAAKYWSECARCGAMIEPRTKVVWTPTKKQVHHLGNCLAS